MNNLQKNYIEEGHKKYIKDKKVCLYTLNYLDQSNYLIDLNN
jgi:hypothetical protein